MTSTTTSCTSSGNALRPSLCEQVGGEQRCFIPLLLSNTRDQCVRRGIGQLVEPALQGGSRRLGPTNGYSPRAGEIPEGTLALKLSATTKGVLDLSDRCTKRLNEVISPSSKFWLRPGDILIQRANSLDYVGTCAIYNGPENTYIYPDLMIRVRVSSPVLGRWIWRYLSSASARRYLINNATGTAGNMPKINGSTIKQMLIPLPPLERLAVCLEDLERALAAFDNLSKQLDRANALVDRLDEATLAKAFRGELTTNDLTDRQMVRHGECVAV